MKKSNQKLMLGISILLTLIVFIFFIVAVGSDNKISVIMLFGIPAIILWIITWAKWGSENEHKEKKEEEAEIEIGKIKVKAKKKK